MVPPQLTVCDLRLENIMLTQGGRILQQINGLVCFNLGTRACVFFLGMLRDHLAPQGPPTYRQWITFQRNFWIHPKHLIPPFRRFRITPLMPAPPRWPPRVKTTHQTTIPSWGQRKTLTVQARELLEGQKVKNEPKTLF